MKWTKWTKWQLGAAAAVGAALLLQQTKDSPAFARAVAEHQGGAATPTAGAQQQTDPVVQERQNSSVVPGTNTRPQRRGHRQSADLNGGETDSGTGGQQQAQPAPQQQAPNASYNNGSGSSGTTQQTVPQMRSRTTRS